MAFARIITRSHQYAQQLALDLLARGYTVEIVSPDAITSTPADLELRVETSGTESGVVAEMDERKSSASLDYLQRLKPLMADLLKKWPSSHDRARSASETGNTFNFNREQELPDDVELPNPEVTSRVEEAQRLEPAVLESARLISKASSSSSKQEPESIFSITGEPLAWCADSEPARQSEVWFWRAAVGFAGTALLILVLGMAFRQAHQVAGQTGANSADLVPKFSSGSVPATPAPATAALSSGSKGAALAATRATTVTSLRAKPSPAVRRTKGPHFEEVVNGDTTVTYFNAKSDQPAKPAATTPQSGIRHYSDLN